jgi:hypothetical protein
MKALVAATGPAVPPIHDLEEHAVANALTAASGTVDHLPPGAHRGHVGRWLVGQRPTAEIYIRKSRPDGSRSSRLLPTGFGWIGP